MPRPATPVAQTDAPAAKVNATTTTNKDDRPRAKTAIGPCFNCNEMGHLARDCPKPKKERARGPPRVNIRNLLAQGVLTLRDIQEGVNEYASDCIAEEEPKEDFPTPQ